MAIVYQLTFFLALGLLAMVVAIFVFAVSQIGRATESASRGQQDILNQQKAAKIKQIEQIEIQLAEDRKVGQLNDAKLSEEIKKFQEEKAGYERELNHLQERIKLIRRKGAVIFPGTAFIISAILNISASGLSESQTHLKIALWLWIISIAAILFGVYRIFRTLGAIEQVTVNSQEVIEKLPDAVKSALREIEEEKKPEILLLFEDRQPPYNVKADSEFTIRFRTFLKKGNIARNCIVYFWIPPDFKFIDCAKGPKSETNPDYISAEFLLDDILRPIIKKKTIKMKATNKKDIYNAFYAYTCENFNSGRKNFEIVVE